MRLRHLAASILLTASAAAAVTAAPAHAIGLAGSPCTGGPATHAATTTLTNRPDSGGGGNDWAADGPRDAANPTGKMDRALYVTLVSHAGTVWEWTGQVCDSGTFRTIAGQLAPNQGPGHAGQTIRAQVTGMVTGVANYQFSTDQPLSTAANLGVVKSEDGAPAPGSDETTSLWFEQAFPPGTTFSGPGIGAWSWTYKAGLFSPQSWTDASSNNDGQDPGAGQITG